MMDLSIYVRWSQKDYSSKRIINYHSFHPMRANVVKEYVKNALKLTTSGYRNLTINLLRKTLRNSDYSHAFINEYMNQAERELISENLINDDCYLPVYPDSGFPKAGKFLRGTVKKNVSDKNP